MGTPKASKPPTSVRRQQWADEQVQFEASGLTVREFCRQNSRSVSGFYQRRAVIRELGYPGLRPRQASKARPQTSATSVGFIDAGILESTGQVKNLSADAKVASAPPAMPPRRVREEGKAANASVEVRIDLGLGVVLTIVRH